MAILGAPGLYPGLRGQPTNVYYMHSGTTQLIPPGFWYVTQMKYTRVQEFDFVTGIWRSIGDGGPALHVYSDGVNFRLANLTGCPVGAFITNCGTLYTSPPTVTAASSGGSVWQAIVGGAISTTITVTNGGSNYTYPPNVQIAAPPNPGVQATAYATLSGGAVSTITVLDQGAGYPAAPQVILVNDPREGYNGTTVGSGATATSALTGSGLVTAILCLDPGSGGVTSLPSFTFSGGGGSGLAATIIMDWSVTGYTVSTGGAAYTPSSGGVEVSANNRITAGTAGAVANPTTSTGLVRQRRASIYAPCTAGVITATGLQVNDGGHYTYAPTSTDTLIIVGQSIVTTAASLSLTVGGNDDVVRMFPA